MQTGVFEVRPRDWYDILCHNHQADPIPDFRVNELHESYLEKRYNVCKSLKMQDFEIPNDDNILYVKRESTNINDHKNIYSLNNGKIDILKSFINDYKHINYMDEIQNLNKKIDNMKAEQNTIQQNISQYKNKLKISI